VKNKSRYPRRDKTVLFAPPAKGTSHLPHNFDPSLCERTTVDSTIPFQFFHSGSRPVKDNTPWLLDWMDERGGTRSTGFDFLYHIDDKWITQYLKASMSLKEILSLLVKGELVGVSDGSFHPKRKTGSMGWCLATLSGKIVLQGGGLIPGGRDSQGSYRSEAGGLLALVTIIQALEEKYPGTIEPYTMKLACDGESALYRSLTGGREKLNTSIKHSDILSRTHDRKDAIRSLLLPVHVYGHRDDISQNLSVLELLNVRMDKLAKAIALVGRRDNVVSLDGLPGSKDGYPVVRVRNKVISSELERSLMSEVAGFRIQKWWLKKHRFRQSDINRIDWHCMAKCMSSCGPRFHRFIPKWVTGQIAVGKVMAMREARAHNHCPRCSADLEDTSHVLHCQHEDAVKTWSVALTKVKEWCLKVDTHPLIVESIFPLLTEWQASTCRNHHTSRAWNREIRDAFWSQAHLGWHSLLAGILSTEWALLQDRHYQSLGSRKLGSKWSSDFSKRLWEAVYSMWEHRNLVMHNTGKITEFSGGKELTVACTFEFSLGCAHLDAIFHPYFDISSSEFTQESADYKRNWFSIIRQAREASGQVTYTDLFSRCQSSRDWVGLGNLQCS